MTLFDSYLFVDWSAKNGRSPVAESKDSIWIGWTEAQGEIQVKYFRTRMYAIDQVRQFLLEAIAKKKRVLVGFDFVYGYPAGLAVCLGNDGKVPHWKFVWDEIANQIVDDDMNRNNRFEVATSLNRRIGGGAGPFWSAPARYQTEWLTGKRIGQFEYPYRSKIGPNLDEFRLTETVLRGTQSAWKLYAPGSVGGQGLTGIPNVRSLRFDPELDANSTVWPFETGFEAPRSDHGPLVCHTEIWPGVAEQSLDGTDKIIDRAQVSALCSWASTLDRSNRLAELFFEPEGLSEDQVEKCVNEEGWILGAR